MAMESHRMDEFEARLTAVEGTVSGIEDRLGRMIREGFARMDEGLAMLDQHIDNLFAPFNGFMLTQMEMNKAMHDRLVRLEERDNNNLC